MYQSRQRFSEINVAYVLRYRPSFEEGQFCATRKLDNGFLVLVLHVIDVSILTNISNSSIYPKSLYVVVCTLLACSLNIFAPFFIQMSFKLVTTVEVL